MMFSPQINYVAFLFINLFGDSIDIIATSREYYSPELTRLDLSDTFSNPSSSAEFSPSTQRGHAMWITCVSTVSLTWLHWASGVWNKVNSSRPGDAYLRQWTELSWAAGGLSRTNPSSEPVLKLLSDGPSRTNISEFSTNNMKLCFRKTHFEMSSAKYRSLYSGSNLLTH